MPTYEIETDQGIFEIDADREPTMEEAMQAMSTISDQSSSAEPATQAAPAVAPISEDQNAINQFIASQQASPLEKAKTMTGGLIDALITQPIAAAGRAGTSFVRDAVNDPKAFALRMANPATALYTPESIEGAARAGVDVTTGLQGLAQNVINNLTQRPLETLVTGGGLIQSLIPRTPTETDINNFLVQREAEQQVQQLKSEPILPPILGEPDLARAEDINTLIQGSPVGVGVGPVAKGATRLGNVGVDLLKPSPKKTIEKFGQRYREILAPGKGEINKIEVKSGKNLDDSYKLAAEEGLLIEKTPDNKLDTLGAVEQLQKPMDEIQSELSSVISSKPQKQFDIKEIGEKSKEQIRKSIKNDADYFEAVKQIDAEVEAITQARGGQISASELNEIKQGLWSKGYNPMAPNSNKVARMLGNEAKEAIEAAYPDADIKGLNAKLGEYLTLRNLLETSHGRVVSRGKLGKYFAQGIGAVAGHAVGVPVAGELGGAWLGGKISDLLTDPARITGRMANRVSTLPRDPNAVLATTPRAVPPTLPATPPPIPTGQSIQDLIDLRNQQIAQSIGGGAGREAFQEIPLSAEMLSQLGVRPPIQASGQLADFMANLQSRPAPGITPGGMSFVQDVAAREMAPSLGLEVRNPTIPYSGPNLGTVVSESGSPIPLRKPYLQDVNEFFGNQVANKNLNVDDAAKAMQQMEGSIEFLNNKILDLDRQELATQLEATAGRGAARAKMQRMADIEKERQFAIDVHRKLESLSKSGMGQALGASMVR